MATVARPGPFVTKPAEQLIETAEATRLGRAVGALDLTALGIGAIIGTCCSSGSRSSGTGPGPQSS